MTDFEIYRLLNQSVSFTVLSNTSMWFGFCCGFILCIAMLIGFRFSMHLFLEKKKIQKPKFIDFDTKEGIRRLYRIGPHYYTKDDYDKNLDARKAYGEI